MSLRKSVLLLLMLTVLVAGCSEKSIQSILGDNLANPLGMALDPGGDFLYVVNTNAESRYESGSLSVIDLGPPARVIPGRSVFLPTMSSQMIIEGGYAFINNRRSEIDEDLEGDYTWVMDVSTPGFPRFTDRVPVSEDPYGIAAYDGQALVANYSAALLSRFDLSSPFSPLSPLGLQSTALPTGSAEGELLIPGTNYHEIAVQTEADGATYDKAVLSNASTGALMIVDLVNMQKEAAIVINSDIGAGTRDVAFVGPDLLYVANRRPNDTVVVDTVLVFDLSSIPNDDTFEWYLYEDIMVASSPHGVGAAQMALLDGLVFLTSQHLNQVEVMNATTHKVFKIIPVGRAPYGIVAGEDCGGGGPSACKLYVANFYGNSISVIDRNSFSVIETIENP